MEPLSIGMAQALGNCATQLSLAASTEIGITFSDRDDSPSAEK
jgi:hypothetical protein